MVTGLVIVMVVVGCYGWGWDYYIFCDTILF